MRNIIKREHDHPNQMLHMRQGDKLPLQQIRNTRQQRDRENQGFGNTSVQQDVLPADDSLTCSDY